MKFAQDGVYYSINVKTEQAQHPNNTNTTLSLPEYYKDPFYYPNPTRQFCNSFFQFYAIDFN